MTPQVSAIVVNYRSAELAARCIASLSREITRAGLPAEILLVDSASGADETEALSRIPADRLLRLPENRGYAGGVNAGLAQARGELVLLSNADVEYAPGSLTLLCAAARDARVAAVGPAAFWDAGGRVRMPPGFAPGFWRDLAQYLAGRLPALDRRRFASHARATLALWRAGGETDHLPGFALAARREVFDRLGGFDESFPHEYEETEWEDRARRAGLSLLYLPGARVTHLWGGSARGAPEEARERRARSRRLYRRRRFGAIGAALLERAAMLARRPERPTLPGPRLPAAPGHWVAISPNASGIPFAGAPLDSDFLLPEEIVQGLAPGIWLFTVFRERDGVPVSAHRWEKAA